MHLIALLCEHYILIIFLFVYIQRYPWQRTGIFTIE
jgi:hypothetical protein